MKNDLSYLKCSELTNHIAQSFKIRASVTVASLGLMHGRTEGNVSKSHVRSRLTVIQLGVRLYGHIIPEAVYMRLFVT